MFDENLYKVSYFIVRGRRWAPSWRASSLSAFCSFTTLTELGPVSRVLLRIGMTISGLRSLDDHSRTDRLSKGSQGHIGQPLTRLGPWYSKYTELDFQRKNTIKYCQPFCISLIMNVLSSNGHLDTPPSYHSGSPMRYPVCLDSTWFNKRSLSILGHLACARHTRANWVNHPLFSFTRRACSTTVDIYYK